MVAEWTEILKGVRIGWDAIDAITKNRCKVWQFLVYWEIEFPFNLILVELQYTPFGITYSRAFNRLRQNI